MAVTTTDREIKVLRPYQEIGRDFLINVRRGFLKDDPGLGKTLQASSAIELPGMIIAPNHLTAQWVDFLEKQYNGIKIAYAYGTRKEKEKILDKKADIYVINKEMLAIYDLPIGIKTFVVDECHHLRSPNADVSRAAYSYFNKDPNSRIYMLSATPAWNTVADLYMQLHITYPKVFDYSYREFVRTWCSTVDYPYGAKVIGVKKHLRGAIRKLLNPIMLGRTNKDVGRQLPPVIENTILIDLDKPRRQLYDRLKNDYRLQYDTEEGKKNLIFSPVGMLHALRQITAHSGKFQAIADLVEDNRLPSLIGFWYKDHAQEMYKVLPKGSAVLLTGDVDARERFRLALQAQKDGKHIVCTEEAIREGVNLYNYRQVICGEEHYVPSANDQFVKRVIRDRNDNGADQTPVLKYCVHVRKSVDEEVHRRAVGKGKSIEDFIEAILR